MSAEIHQWLALLDCDVGDLLGYDLLNGGMSGAATIRLQAEKGIFVLKTTSAESPSFVWEGGVRETLFYNLLAATLPIVTPEVVGTYGPSSALGCALLLKAYEPAPKVKEWEDAAFVDVTRQLARLHAKYWGAVDSLSEMNWLRRARDEVPNRQQAEENWQVLWAQERLGAVFPAETVARLEIGLELPICTAKAVTSEIVPHTLCHGDAHHGNLLCTRDGTWVWADWQEVGIGYGPEDLSFFHQRATAGGAKVRVQRIIDVYCAEMAQLGVDVSSTSVEELIFQSELRTRLLEWPAYLTQASEESIRTHVERILFLMRRCYYRYN